MILDDSEKFVVYSGRYFNKLFHELGYTTVIQNFGPYIVVTYSSNSIGQDILITYDFLRSDKPYYQIEVTVIKKGIVADKQGHIEIIDYINNKTMPQTIEATLALLKECFCRYFLSVIKGQKWVDEIQKNKAS